MERTGGSGIWIKRLAVRSVTVPGGDAGEVLAVPSAFGALVTVARSEAGKEGL